MSQNDNDSADGETVDNAEEEEKFYIFWDDEQDGNEQRAMLDIN